MNVNRQTEEEPFEGVPRDGQDEGWCEGQEEMIELIVGIWSGLYTFILH